MYSREQLIEFHNELRQVKEHMWYDHKEPDLYPILVVRWRDMPSQAVNVPLVGSMVQVVREHAIANMPEHWAAQVEMGAPLVLWACLGALEDGVLLPGIGEMPAKGTPMESIWLGVEGYGLEGDSEMDLNEIQRGDLKRDYQDNPESKVLERLTTYQVETSSTGLAEWARVTSAFHKDDGGRIVWHEPHIDTSESTTLTEGSYDKLLDIMVPCVTREKLA